MSELLLQLLRAPMTSLAVTLGAYLFGQWLQARAGGHSLANPVVIAIAVVVCFTYVAGIPHQRYMDGVALIHMLLGPVTVALAIPLYKQFELVKRSPLGIGLAMLTTMVVSASVAFLLARALDAPRELQIAIVPKSVSTAIAIGIAEKVHGIPSLTVLFVFSTGILGSLVAPLIFRAIRMKDDKAIGLSLGATCHGLGVALALQKGEVAGAFAVLGMGLMGLISAFVLPLAIVGLIQN